MSAPGGVVLPVLTKLGVELPTRCAPTIAPRARRSCRGCSASASPPTPRVPSSELYRRLGAAEREAQALSDQYVSTEHLLLALAAESGRAGAALRAVGATRERLLRRSPRCAARTASPTRTPRRSSKRSSASATT